MRMARRHVAMGTKGYEGTVDDSGRWTGKVNLLPGRLREPLTWKKPSLVFVDSMSDLFHESVPNEYIAKVFGIMALARQHTFQVLTKRADRLPRWFDWIRQTWDDFCPGDEIDANVALEFLNDDEAGEQVSRDDFPPPWPLPNVWLGVSVEDWKRRSRIAELVRTPAATRFLSIEPLLGSFWQLDLTGIDWVIVGCESNGHHSNRLLYDSDTDIGQHRAENEWWQAADGIRRQCQEAGVAFFMKQGPHQGRVVHQLDQFPKSCRVRQYPRQKVTT
jgi:protein gp37